MIKITYLSHSGFLVELEETYMLFDYYKGELPRMDREKKMLVFVSHAHYDHYKKEIFMLRQEFGSIRFILSSDVDILNAPDIVFMKPGEERDVMEYRIRTFRSTDEGVAFLVTCENRNIYHAGDLNWWHWEGESAAYNTGMRRAYQSEINKLQKERIDVAFVPVDPRLGEQYCLGLDCFMKRTDTDYVFPMHFWGNYEVFDRLELEECTRDYRERIMKISREGESFLLDR